MEYRQGITDIINYPYERRSKFEAIPRLSKAHTKEWNREKGSDWYWYIFNFWLSNEI